MNFKIKHRPYYVTAPDWLHWSAGVRTVHYLVHALNEMGEEAYLFSAERIAPHLRTPRLTQETVDWHVRVQGRDPIAVYPEIVKGNPLGARTVVRWLMNRPGVASSEGESEFPETDLIFFYCPWAVPPQWTRPTRQLFIPCVDPDEMPAGDPNRVRDLEIIYGLRYRHEGGEYSPLHQQWLKEGRLLDLSVEIRTRQALSEVLRRAKVVYVYEPSAIGTDAALSGCPTVYVKNDYMRFDPVAVDRVLLGYGQCCVEFGEEPTDMQWEHMRATIGYARPQWAIRGLKFGEASLREFVKTTQELP